MSFNFSEAATAYNSLPQVFDADATLSQMERTAAIDALLSVVKSHGLTEVVGVRLLHKHNDICADEAMIETDVTDEDGFALITEAQPASRVENAAVPNSWILRAGGFVPMEFSLRHLVKGSISPDSHAAFFAEFGEVLRARGLSELLGPALVASDFVESRRPLGSNLMIELSAHDARANIVRYLVESVEGRPSSVETFWADESQHPLAAAKPWEDPEHRQPLRVCKRICPSVQNPPVHQGTYQHNRS